MTAMLARREVGNFLYEKALNLGVLIIEVEG